MMDYNIKTPSPWDWENLGFYSGKSCDAPKHVQPTDWGIETGSVYSDLGNGSSSKSSISASFDSSSKAGNKASEIVSVEGFPKDTGTSPVRIASAEPLIGLKLGKRTYFEDFCSGSGRNVDKAPSLPPILAKKKTRQSHQGMQYSFCQVEGCNIDLTMAKDYHRKHKVCETHSKSPRVVVAGQERRFCQQCSRFHALMEFDQKKRSCRRRLSDHNARRRKPQPEGLSFNSGRLSSSFYADDRHQMNLAFNNPSFGCTRPVESFIWEGSLDFRLEQAKKGSWNMSVKVGGTNQQLHLPNHDLPNTVSNLHGELDGLLPFKSTNAVVLNQGVEAPINASNLDGAQDLRRALSLLSTNSWGSTDPVSTSSLNQFVISDSDAAQPMMQVNPPPNLDYWSADQSSVAQSRAIPFALNSNGNQFQEFQLLKAPYEAAFFDSSQIH